MGIHFLQSSSLRWRSVIIFASILFICFLILLVQDGVFNQTSMLIDVFPPFMKHVDNASDVPRKDGNNESPTFGNQVTCTIGRVVVDGRPLCTPTSMKPDNSSSLFYCNWTKTPYNNYSHRLQASLSCNTSNPDITLHLVYNDTRPDEYEYNDTCLDAVIKSKCYGGNAVPRLVHFVNFGHRELPFYGLLSITSAFRFVQPCLILIHGDYPPFGIHWDRLAARIPNVLFIHRPQPTTIFGHEISVIEHSADIARLEAIRRFGGIYMDIDHVLINPLTKLMNYSVVMSVETEGQAIGNGMFLGSAGAKFLDVWYDAYHSFNDKEWGTHSVIMPFKLHQMFPHLDLHLEENLFKPYDRIQIHEMYNNRYDWTKLFGIHLYARYSEQYLNYGLETFSSSMGEIVRRILYGNHMSCFGKL